MCTTYLVSLQERKGKGKNWKTVESFELPPEDAPLCGCWLFMSDEQVRLAREAHEAAANDWEATERDAERLKAMCKDALYEAMGRVTQFWDTQRLVIERVV